MPLFDRTKIPEGVFRKEALDYLDELIGRFNALKAETVVVTDPDTGFRVPGMARALSQRHIWRCVELAESSASLCHLGHWLSAMSNARMLIETIAAFSHITKALEPIVESGDVQEIHDFLHVKTFPTKLKSFIEAAGDDAVKATSVLNQIDTWDKWDSRSIREDYDYLCEYVHPNGSGTFLFFGEQDLSNGSVLFKKEGWIVNEAFGWVGNICSRLDVALNANEKMEALAIQISGLEPTEAKD